MVSGKIVSGRVSLSLAERFALAAEEQEISVSQALGEAMEGWLSETRSERRERVREEIRALVRERRAQVL